MKILLDTQVFIWLVHDDPRLGVESRRVVVSTQNQVFISFLSFFEMAIKASLGKLTFDPLLMNDLEKMGITLIPGDYQSLSHYQIYNQENKDPFDNFLIATAKANNLQFLSSDHKILQTKIEGVDLMNATK